MASPLPPHHLAGLTASGVVLCWRLDRLGRNLKHLITLLDEFQALGIAFVVGTLLVIPAGVAHDAHNAGDQPIKLIGVYVVGKGKPLASPAP